MSARMILFSVLIFLLLTVPVSAADKQDITIYQALQIGEKAEMGTITSVVKTEDGWIIKGSNLHNSNPSALIINAQTGLVTSARNITPKAIILGENTYEYSGGVYPYNTDFFKTGQVYNGFEIYQNNSRYFKMKHAIFINTEEGFIAYFMTEGPEMTK